MQAREPLYQVRNSRIHGHGVFAVRKIRKGTRILEYCGERISHDEADRRYNDTTSAHAHIVLFAVDADTVIDGAVEGNDGRFVNHSCDPNCEAVMDEGRIFIEAIKTVRPGEELSYDYSLELDPEFDAEWSHLYTCRCGAANCRGEMLKAH